MAEPTAVIKTAAPIVGKLAGPLWRRFRPDTSVQALASRADQLAADIRLREEQALEDLGVNRGLGVDLSFNAHVHIRAAGGRDVGDLANVSTFYESLDPPARLVVLGQPGAGKTVLVLHLLLDLLDARPTRVETLTVVPLRANAASWDSSVSLTDWLTERLSADYNVPPGVGRELLRRRKILPFLDGLDEMDPPDTVPDRARRAVDQLNANPWRGQPLVVVSRATEYDRIRHLARGGQDAGLHRSTAITVEPLVLDESLTYLTRRQAETGTASEPWQLLRTHLASEPDGALARGLSTPWLLTLTAHQLEHHGALAARQLIAAESESRLRDVLFSGLIPTAIEATPRRRRGREYRVEEVHRWLHNLAQHLEMARIRGAGGTDISPPEIAAMAGPRLPRVLHGLLAGTVAATLTGSMTFGTTHGIAAVALTALCFLSGVAQGFPERPSIIQRRDLWKNARRSYKGGLVGGTLLGLGASLLTATLTGFEAELGTVLAPTFGLAFFIGFASFAVFVDDASSDNTDIRLMIRDDLRIATATAFIGGAFLAAWVLMAVGMGSTLWLAAGVFLWLITVLSRAGIRHVIGCVALALQGRFPLKAVAFLEWARGAGLIRVTGLSYQFRHETYRAWLLSRPDASGELD